MTISPKVAAFAGAAWLCCTSVHAAITCSTVTATSVNGVYTKTVALNQTGAITVTCTRLATDPTTQVIYIGLDQGEPPAGRNMTRQTGTQLLVYRIYRNATPSGSWSTGTGRAPAVTTAGGLQTTFTFASTATTVQSTNYPYYFNVAANITSAAGIYDDELVGVTVRLNNSAGTVQSTTTFAVNASIQAECRFSTSPTAMALVYNAFAATAVSAYSPFAVSCTQGTSYGITLDASSAVLLGLKYDLLLVGATTDTVLAASLSGTGFAQSYRAKGSIVAGQAGSCATGTCTASATRALTITY